MSRARTAASAVTDGPARHTRRAVSVAAAGSIAWTLARCGRGGGRAPSADGALVVFAAASLRQAFNAMRETFVRGRPGVDALCSYAGSQELRTQIEHGAPADVFASADVAHMSALVRAGLARDPVVFARNELVVAVTRGDPQAIRGFSELPSARRAVLGAADVPVGRYAATALDRASAGGLGADFRARVERRVVSRELNVRQVVAKVAMGEADAAIVYRTDAMAMIDRVNLLEIPREFNVIAEYPVAALAQSPRPALARAWVAHVTSSEGQRALREAGFIVAGRGR